MNLKKIKAKRKTNSLKLCPSMMFDKMSIRLENKKPNKNPIKSRKFFCKIMEKKEFFTNTAF